MKGEIFTASFFAGINSPDPIESCSITFQTAGVRSSKLKIIRLNASCAFQDTLGVNPFVLKDLFVNISGIDNTGPVDIISPPDSFSSNSFDLTLTSQAPCVDLELIISRSPFFLGMTAVGNSFPGYDAGYFRGYIMYQYIN